MPSWQRGFNGSMCGFQPADQGSIPAPYLFFIFTRTNTGTTKSCAFLLHFDSACIDHQMELPHIEIYHKIKTTLHQLHNNIPTFCVHQNVYTKMDSIADKTGTSLGWHLGSLCSLNNHMFRGGVQRGRQPPLPANHLQHRVIIIAILIIFLRHNFSARSQVGYQNCKNCIISFLVTRPFLPVPGICCNSASVKPSFLAMLFTNGEK